MSQEAIHNRAIFSKLSVVSNRPGDAGYTGPASLMARPAKNMLAVVPISLHVSSKMAYDIADLTSGLGGGLSNSLKILRQECADRFFYIERVRLNDEGLVEEVIASIPTPLHLVTDFHAVYDRNLEVAAIRGGVDLTDLGFRVRFNEAVLDDEWQYIALQYKTLMPAVDLETLD